MSILNDADASEDEHEMAIATIAEALFPPRYNGQPGIDFEVLDRKEASSSKEVGRVSVEMDQEEASFADRVQSILRDRGLPQLDLATACGIGQPAVSNLRSRGSRPQRRTVAKIAETLKVPPRDLWPDFEEA